MVDSLKVIARRLVVLRTALKLSQSELVSTIDVGASTYSPFETGKRRITPDAAAKLRNHYGASLDWIYCGIADCLPHSLHLLLPAAEAEVDMMEAAKRLRRARKPGKRNIRRIA